jgi:hypothetical protein
MSAYFKKSERFQINNQMMHVKALGKQELTKPKISSWKEIIKIRHKLIKWRLKIKHKQ